MKLISAHNINGIHHAVELDRRNDIELFIALLFLMLKLGVHVRCDLAAFLLKNEEITRVQWTGFETSDGRIIDSLYKFYSHFGPALHEWRPVPRV